MEESTGSAARDPARLGPPRWRGIQSLDLVHQLNERCIELLRDAAEGDVRGVTLAVVTEHRELWTHLTVEARRAVARLPFIIVDAHFTDAEWWRRAVEHPGGSCEAQERINGLPSDVSEHLMHEATMFAWQTARWDPTVAALSLGIAPAVAAIIAAMTPRQIRVIASRENRAIQIRWADNARFWRDLLVAARAGDEKRLAALHLHAKLLLCSELDRVRAEKLNRTPLE